MEIAGINKELSFHCARHTFATVALTIGIPVEVVADLLGHENLQTTKIYAKIVDRLKDEQMNKWVRL
jgi:site-specific recombinase XerD